MNKEELLLLKEFTDYMQRSAEGKVFRKFIKGICYGLYSENNTSALIALGRIEVFRALETLEELTIEQMNTAYGVNNE